MKGGTTVTKNSDGRLLFSGLDSSTVHPVPCDTTFYTPLNMAYTSQRNGLLENLTAFGYFYLKSYTRGWEIVSGSTVRVQV